MIDIIEELNKAMALLVKQNSPVMDVELRRQTIVQAFEILHNLKMSLTKGEIK